MSLSGHGADLCELSALHPYQQVGGTGWVHLEGGLEHVQGTVPTILVAAVEKEFELGNVERQVHFRDTAIGADHLTQPGPGAFHGVAVDLALAVTVQVEGVLTSTVIDSHMLIAITGEKVVDAITVRIDPRTALHHLVHNGLDGLRLYVAQHKQTNLAAPTQQAKDRQPIAVPGATATPFEPPSACLALQLQATGLSFKPAVIYTSSISPTSSAANTIGSSERVW
jgi:hypothetical protein